MKEHKHKYILLEDPLNLNGCYMLFCEKCLHGMPANITDSIPLECEEPEIVVWGDQKRIQKPNI